MVKEVVAKSGDPASSTHLCCRRLMRASTAGLWLEVIGVSDNSQLQLWDRIEICRIAAVKRQAVSNRARSDQGVIRAGRRLSARRSECCGDCAKGARGLGVEGQHVEVRFGLLQMCLSCRAIIFTLGDVRPHG
jgi:hypothetical protein